MEEQAEEIELGGPDDLRALVGRLRDDYREYVDGGDALADGPSLRIAERAALGQGAPGGSPRRPRPARRRGSRPRRAVLPLELLLAGRARPVVSVRRGRGAPASFGRQPPERGVGGRDRRHDPPRPLTRARLGLHPGGRPLAVRRDEAHADGRAPPRGLGLRPGPDPARRLHLRGLRRPGSDLPARACSATSRRRTSAESGSAPRRSRRWATRRARPTWSSTGPTRPCTPSTAGAGCAGCSRCEVRIRSRGRRCSSAASSSCRRASRAATPEDLERARSCADALVAAAEQRDRASSALDHGQTERARHVSAYLTLGSDGLGSDGSRLGGRV